MLTGIISKALQLTRLLEEEEKILQKAKHQLNSDFESELKEQSQSGLPGKKNSYLLKGQLNEWVFSNKSKEEELKKLSETVNGLRTRQEHFVNDEEHRTAGIHCEITEIRKQEQTQKTYHTQLAHMKTVLLKQITQVKTRIRESNNDLKTFTKYKEQSRKLKIQAKLGAHEAEAKTKKFAEEIKLKRNRREEGVRKKQRILNVLKYKTETISEQVAHFIVHRGEQELLTSRALDTLRSALASHRDNQISITQQNDFIINKEAELEQVRSIVRNSGHSEKATIDDIIEYYDYLIRNNKELYTRMLQLASQQKAMKTTVKEQNSELEYIKSNITEYEYLNHIKGEFRKYIPEDTPTINVLVNSIESLKHSNSAEQLEKCLLTLQMEIACLFEKAQVMAKGVELHNGDLVTVYGHTFNKNNLLNVISGTELPRSSSLPESIPNNTRNLIRTTYTADLIDELPIQTISSHEIKEAYIRYFSFDRAEFEDLTQLIEKSLFVKHNISKASLEKYLMGLLRMHGRSGCKRSLSEVHKLYATLYDNFTVKTTQIVEKLQELCCNLQLNTEAMASYTASHTGDPVISESVELWRKFSEGNKLVTPSQSNKFFDQICKSQLKLRYPALKRHRKPTQHYQVAFTEKRQSLGIFTPSKATVTQQTRKLLTQPKLTASDNRTLVLKEVRRVRETLFRIQSLAKA